jgi:hypothetical protein
LPALRQSNRGRTLAAATAGVSLFAIALWRNDAGLVSRRPAPAVSADALAPRDVATEIESIGAPPNTADSFGRRFGAVAELSELQEERRSVLLPVELERALSAPSGEARAQAVLAALQHWAKHDAPAAAEWAAAQTILERTRAITAVLDVVGENARAAEDLVAHLATRDPEAVTTYGGSLLHALGTYGHHARAAAIASTSSDDVAPQWLSGVYGRWGRRDPEAAIMSALALRDPARQQAAYRAAATAWAQTQPADFAKCAAAFPAGPERDFALIAALRAWAMRDSDAAVSWMRGNSTLLAHVPNLHRVLED